MLSTLGSLLTCAAVIAMKLIGGIDMSGNPLLLLCGLIGMASLQFFVLGLLGEVSARIYYESQNKRPYHIRELVNFQKPDARYSQHAA
jgi:hypothetical protein